MSRDPIAASVDQWLDRQSRGLPALQCAQLFGHATTALCNRAHVTLGDVTLAAISDRVTAAAGERFAFMKGIALWGGDGTAWDGLHARAETLGRKDVLAAARFVLVELITVLDRLTAGILTPALRLELDKVRKPRAPKRRKRKQADR